MSEKFVFDRQDELQSLRALVQKGRSVLIYGPAGVGKSLLIRTAVRDSPQVLYCSDSTTSHTVLRSVATSLLSLESPRIKAACAGGAQSIALKSAVSLKGIVLDALREGQFRLVLDHLNRPGVSFAATIREVTGWATTPVIAVARSAHMEHLGALQGMFADRRDRFEIRNFDSTIAEAFVREECKRTSLQADNVEEFISRLLHLSHGNPGAILAMLDMAKMPQYRSADHIKVTPLYIDFRLRQ